jgi:hypothetical protein
MDLEVMASIKAAYPRRDGGQNWVGAQRQCDFRLRSGHTTGQLLIGAGNYAAKVRDEGKEGTRYVMMAATFFGRDLHFMEYQESMEKFDPTKDAW